MNCWQKEAFKHIPKVSHLTLDEMKRMLAQLDLPGQVLLIASWLHAARAGNLAPVKIKEITFSTDEVGNRWSILWNQAKTVPKVGPYTTHSAIPDEWRKLLELFIGNRSPDSLLFSEDFWKLAMKSLSEALKSVHKTADIRCIRRGALCAMAETGVDLETLLTFSGHTNVQMLLRYLKQGKAAGARAKKGASAARSALC